MKQWNRWFALAAVAAVPLVIPAVAVGLDWRQAPRYGTVSLSSGFLPDPRSVEVEAGGSTNVRTEVGGSCRGYVSASKPDVDLNYTAGSYPLYIYALSSRDTTLVVLDAAGNWHCNDDFSSEGGNNPGVVLHNPPSGNYNIWVGTYENLGSYPNTTLRISEVPPIWNTGSQSSGRQTTGTIEWGDNGSRWANDGECDDPRFAGPGVSSVTLAEDRYHDANDCRQLYEQGMIYLKPGG